MAKKRKGKNKPAPKKAKTGGSPKGTASTASNKKAKAKRPKGIQKHVLLSHAIETSLLTLKGRSRTIRNLQSKGESPQWCTTMLDWYQGMEGD